MKIVIDTNIVFSAILNSNSRIGQILLQPDKDIQFYSVKYLQTEIRKHFNKIKNIIKIPDSEIFILIETLFGRIQFISEELIPRDIRLIADELTKSIDFDDTLFVALALHLDCKLWTGDKHLIDGLSLKSFKNIITTQELINLSLK